MTLYALRHLPTPWNRAGRLQGRADIATEPPTAAVLELIAANRRVLDEIGPFDQVCCSTLRRTAESAAAYGYRTVRREPLLDEFDFGSYEGKLRDELLADCGEAWISAPHTVTLGESMNSLERRIRKFLRDRHSLEKVLIFGHGCWLRALLSLELRNTLAETNRLTLAEHAILRIDGAERFA